MFAIHYYNGNSVVAIEGPVESAEAAKTYLENRTHYLEFRPRLFSLSPLRNSTALPAPVELDRLEVA